MRRRKPKRLRKLSRRKRRIVVDTLHHISNPSGTEESASSASPYERKSILRYPKRKYSKWKHGRIVKVLVFPFQRRSLSTTAAAIVCLSSFASFVYLRRSAPTEIRAELSGLGDINFTYSGHQNQ